MMERTKRAELQGVWGDKRTVEVTTDDEFGAPGFLKTVGGKRVTNMEYGYVTLEGGKTYRRIPGTDRLQEIWDL